MLLCACGPGSATASSSALPLATVSGTGTPIVPVTGINTTNLLTVLLMLQKSVQAMLKLSSVHFDLQRKGTVQPMSPVLPALANKATYTLSGRGDVSFARDEEQLKAGLTLYPEHAVTQKFTLAERLI